MTNYANVRSIQVTFDQQGNNRELNSEKKNWRRIEFGKVVQKKGLKIPKGWSEATNRKTDNTMVKRQTTIYKTLHGKLKIE